MQQPDQLRQRVALALRQILVGSNLEVSGTHGLRGHRWMGASNSQRNTILPNLPNFGCDRRIGFVWRAWRWAFHQQGQALARTRVTEPRFIPVKSLSWAAFRRHRHTWVRAGS